MLALSAWLACPVAALAHASFVRSDPPDVCGPLATPRLEANDPRCQTGFVLAQAPTTVRILFSEPVQIMGRGIRVVSPAGKPVQTGKASADGDEATVEIDASEPGTYVVEWQVVSADTHPARGRFAFSVERPSQPALSAAGEIGQVTPLGLALQAFARWLHFLGYAFAFGTLAVFLLLDGFAAAHTVDSPAALRLTNAGIVLLLVAEPFAVLGQTGSLGLDQLFDGDALGDALASPFGRLLGFRVAAVLLLWVVSGSLRAPTSSLEVNQRLAAGVALALGAALAVIDGLSQHAASFSPLWLGLIVHAGHLMAMSLWLGALVIIVVIDQRLAGLGLIVGTSFGLIAVTGLAMAVVHIPQPSSLLNTAYGLLLGGKQIPVLAASALGWLALRRRGVRPWAAELGALLIVTALAGLLVSLPPPR